MTEALLASSPLLNRAGAVPAEGADAGVAWHYGDPVREQRELEAGRARVDLSHRGVVTVSGPDRLTWLNSLTTQALAALPARTSAEALILSPHGHVEHAMHLVDDGTTVWITVEPGTAPALVEYLRRMQFMLRVQVDDVSADWAVVAEAVRGEGAEGGPVTWSDPWPHVTEGGTAYGPDDAEHPGWAWRELLVPRESLKELATEGEWAGTWAAEALRVAAWRPRLGAETDHRTIPHEVDWLRTAVHLQKGCYRGQETVARVHNLGRPPRRLVLLHLDGSVDTLPEPGADVLLREAPEGSRALGRVTSAARHHELGPIALAVVKRNTPVEAEFVVDGVPAAQEPIVGA
ncbi:YgfZ/GcvT domain-containing protein [Spongisporangium articulatum]|uniref:YgfZ/GcvT domain-containing protein n=1 Tax=Spongisporangium articulatum TaxID=3362603 RepID=A0ABW8AJS2_9ACTN